LPLSAKRPSAPRVRSPDSCAAKGYTVSAVVVDRAGDVIVAMRADSARPYLREQARRRGTQAFAAAGDQRYSPVECPHRRRYPFNPLPPPMAGRASA